jgi:hypothetical protein
MSPFSVSSIILNPPQRDSFRERAALTSVIVRVPLPYRLALPGNEQGQDNATQKTEQRRKEQQGCSGHDERHEQYPGFDWAGVLQQDNHQQSSRNSD